MLSVLITTFKKKKKKHEDMGQKVLEEKMSVEALKREWA